MEIKPVKGKCKIPDKKQMGYIGVSRWVSQLNNPEMTSEMTWIGRFSILIRVTVVL